MLELLKAPEKGKIYAVLRDRIVFQSYESLAEVETIANDERLLELHLFDVQKEYRAVRTRMNGFLESVIDEKWEDTYEEKIYVLGDNIDIVEELQNQVVVVNQVTYNADDMLNICNYRLKEVE